MANDIQDLKKSIEELNKTLKEGMRTGSLGGGGDKGGTYRRNIDEDKPHASEWADRWTRGNATDIKQAKEAQAAQLDKAQRARNLRDSYLKQREHTTDPKERARLLREAHKAGNDMVAAEKEAAKQGKAVKAGKAGAAAAIASEVEGLAKGVIGTVYGVLANEMKRKEVKMAKAHEMEMRNIEAWGQAMTGVAQAQADFLTKDVLAGAYSALNTVVAAGKTSIIKKTQDDLTIAQQAAEMKKLNLDNTNQIQKGAVGLVSSVASMIGPIGAAVGSALNILSSVADAQLEREKAKIDLDIKLKEMVQKQVEAEINKINEAVQPLMNAAQEITATFYKMQTQAFSFGRSLMLSSENLHGYSQSVFRMAVDLAEVGMNLDDYYKTQTSYNESAGGRSNIIGTTEAQGIGALSKVLGVSPDEVASINGAMNVFNTSIEDGNDLIYSMSKNAARMGLNTTKYAKDLQKNLKLAEKYQFKDGVKGVMRMSAWAQKMRVDMSSMVSSMEKLHSGNIEDTIQTSAKLNVLGGNAALMSDPMSMLYNAYADPEQYAKNVANMVSGFGHFNKKTGMTEFNINEQMRMEAMASALGMSKEDFFNMARQQDKEKQIKRSFGNKFGEKTDFVTQNATWSKDKQDWVVKVKDGKGGFSEVGLGDLKGEDDKRLEQIFPEDKQDQIIDIINDIRNLLSPEEAQKRAKEIQDSRVREASYDVMTNTGYQMADQTEEWAKITSNINQYAEAIKATQEAAVKAQKIMQDQVSEGQGVVLLKEVLNSQIKSSQNFYKDMFENENSVGNMIIKGGMTLAEALEAYTHRMEELLPEGAGGSFYGKDYFKKNEISATEIKKMQERITEQDRIKAAQIAGEHGDENLSAWITNGGNIGKDEMGNIFMLDLAHGKNYGNVLVSKTSRYEARQNLPIKSSTETQNDSSNDLSHSTEGTLHESDFILSPKLGKIIPDPDDVILGMKPGGSIDRAAQQNAGTPSNINLTVTGTLALSSGNQKIDLMELIRNNPDALRELTQLIVVQGSKNVYGGKGQVLPHRFTFGN